MCVLGERDREEREGIGTGEREKERGGRLFAGAGCPGPEGW